MARDPQWIGTLGNAVLVQRNDVMDAVQRMRRAARNYGYLAPNSYDNVVDNGGYLEIQPVNPAYLYVPVYNPGVVFFAPRPGFFVGGAVVFGPRIFLSPGFATFGWGGAGFGWGGHAILIDHRPWGRTYWNRGVYVHPYAHPYVVHGGGAMSATPMIAAMSTSITTTTAKGRVLSPPSRPAEPLCRAFSCASNDASSQER